MRVATYNAHRGRGPAGPFRPERILAVVAEIRPDVIALQEAQHYLRRGRPMLDAAMAAELGLMPLAPLERPEHQGWRGNLLLVRRDAAVLAGPTGLRLGGMEPRGALLAVLDLGQGPVRVIGTHLSLGEGRRRRQAAALLAAMESGPGRDLPTLLLGDLNEWRPGRGALAVLAPVFGEPPRAPTFPAFRPLASLDRILGHPRGLVEHVAVHDTPLARRASDHLPLTARVETALLRRAG
ncbi:endonuclease/exonuclease/phosphatase family protein [Roseicella aquatilis]|uniref:EEP domain-containing protein n=1 Tax=Roseicella aquatilis TaxID=2527868 RepID=A0A4R4DIC6_9PROT|nr:endonuclease/exonuclease/phosphatase family protein [Roseicella aquatilis]TCZ60930.1 EEP domain-containing protein [Roseicella aquatilis]